ncbi:MAG: carbon-nitrogen hydrolase family protein [Pirellulales bacterium]
MFTQARSLALGLVLLSFPALADALEQEVVITVYQGVCQEGDFSRNLEKVREVVAKARKRESDFLVFPETFLSGYESRAAVERGARPLDDPELQAFIAESANHDMVILAGLARRAEDRLFNTILILQAGKLLGHYDKVMLTGGDRDPLGFSPGESVPVFFAHGVHFAVNICHDTSFPHVAMLASKQGAEILLTPHYNEINEETLEDHRRWVRHCHVGLATQCKMAVARSNVVKKMRAGARGYGDSFILSPQGTTLAEAKPDEEALITATITPAHFRSPVVWSNNAEVPGWLRDQLAAVLREARPAHSEEELRDWLENMYIYHRYSAEEIAAATGLRSHEVRQLLDRWELSKQSVPSRQPGEPLRVLPYPGGRHPRIGFREGAIAPQRETKFSLFTPWDPLSYVVVDVPEAIFAGSDLIFLAHTHVPTIWSQRQIELARLEWTRGREGRLSSRRTLPNGVTIEAEVVPNPTEVRMTLRLHNGSAETLRNIRVQNCVMLSRAEGFAAQSNENKIFSDPYAAVRSGPGDRWIITAWNPVQRCWGNERCPCLHSDPTLPDASPGKTVEARGWISFYEGTDIDGELERIAATGWSSRAGEVDGQNTTK